MRNLNGWPAGKGGSTHSGYMNAGETNGLSGALLSFFIILAVIMAIGYYFVPMLIDTWNEK